MGRINVLSFEVANLIAAGEVVDRPASVVKELMENAIDSGADRITVEIQHGGVTLISVTDNGCGMAADELPVAIRRHATSKIRDAADLDGIVTLGFRGEALAAIASVSHLRIISRERGTDTGAMLEADCGNIVGVTERGAAEGTRIIVEDLFSNVPARRKFLKKDATEAMAVAAYVEKIALSHPEIAMRLIVDGTMKIDTVGDGNLKNTVYSLFGKEFASKLLDCNIELDGIRVSGFIGRTDNVRANRNFQNFFINGRYIRSKTAMAALEQAYTSYIPPEKFPCCVLRIDVNPTAVDVNVHPAKLEVKFSNERPVFEAVYYAVRGALEANVSRPSIDTARFTQGSVRVSDMTTPIPEKKGESLKARQVAAELFTAATPEPQKKEEPKKPAFEHISAEQYVKEYLGGMRATGVRVDTVKEIPKAQEKEKNNFPTMPNEEAAKPTVEEKIIQTPNTEPTPAPAPRIEEKIEARVETKAETKVETKAEKPLSYRIVGEVFNSYVLVERGDSMLIIDKHAAHERIIFERLKAGLASLEVTSQMLLIPLEVMMTSDEIRALSEYKSEVEATGFEITAGKYAVSITAIPEGISTDAVPDMLTVMAERILESTGSARLTRDIIFEKALYQASCKAAIKAGREYAPEHVKWIVDKLMELPDVTFCPHGRPVAMEMSHKGLDKQFERC